MSASSGCAQVVNWLLVGGFMVLAVLSPSYGLVLVVCGLSGWWFVSGRKGRGCSGGEAKGP